LLRRTGWSILCTVLASFLGIGAVSVANADTAPVLASASVPGTDPGHATALEALASRIAMHIAGRPVSVHCDGGGEWASVVTQAGGDPAGESGFVATQWNGSTGQLLGLSSVAELSSAICLPLQQFASASTKPTTCVARSARLLAARPAAARPHAGPCYLGAGKTAAPQSQAYWTSYAAYSIAILTLAHESIHLGGVVGGRLSNGLAVGDQQAEAKADCQGMQWMPYVAEQLGDTPDDAQAIARYFWDKIYGLSRVSHPEYWSPDCRPGGALDARPPGTAAWP
jgi:hypothetical protein